MAKSTIDPKVFKDLRASGLRKRLARTVASADAEAGKALRRTVKDQRGLAEQLEDRATHGPAQRSKAAKKAARTRRRKAEARSKAAQKAARTRAQA
jgi:hypothetical protein